MDAGCDETGGPVPFPQEMDMGIAADKVVVSDDAGPMALAPGLIGRKVTALSVLSE